ncbi:WD repeat-containing protein 7-like [Venturia nashicola]|nr:WD repeat-containing protein 7-like [Venturia nashicola]
MLYAALLVQVTRCNHHGTDTVGIPLTSDTVGIPRPLLAYHGHCWHTTATVGIPRPLLAYHGHCWHTTATVGIPRPLLAYHGHCWYTTAPIPLLPYATIAHALLPPAWALVQLSSPVPRAEVPFVSHG